MTLIKSISGFRGTIGGIPGKNLTPIDIVESAAAYAAHIRDQSDGRKIKIVLGRDGRISGSHVSTLVAETLLSMGVNVLDAGLSTTPTIEMAVIMHQADGGIILTASHNPKEWNALKLLNSKGEFLSKEHGSEVIRLSKDRNFQFAALQDWGRVIPLENAIHEHVQKIVQDKWVLTDKVREQNFHIVVDCINSTGALAIPELLKELNCTFHLINNEISGDFAHNPEPLSENLDSLKQAVVVQKADLGIAVDPDVDRLALVDENGKYIGEEYTLVTAADYILSHQQGTFVSNLSSSKALQDWVENKGGSYHAAAVGELNVVEKMKEVKAVLGGEGNGGVIYPALHYGRDALVGIAFVLSHLARTGSTLSELRSQYPNYEMIKDKLELPETISTEKVLAALEEVYKDYEKLTIDGLKVFFEEGWVHLRPSNTEPIIRLYAEHHSREQARKLADQLKKEYLNII